MPLSKLSNILFHLKAHNDHLGEQLDQTPNSNSIDWDKSREILVEVSTTESKVAPLIDAFVSLNRTHASKIGEQAKSRMQRIIQMGMGFSLIVLIFAIFLGKNMNAYIAKNK